MNGLAPALFSAIAWLAMQPNDAPEQDRVSDPLMRCETQHSDSAGALVSRKVYILFPSSDVVGRDGRVFFGGANFYFEDGYVGRSSFLVENPNFESYSREEFERRNLIFLNEGAYYLSTSDIEANAPRATFNIHIRPTGLVETRILDWNGTCTQISATEDEIYISLQSRPVTEL